MEKKKLHMLLLSGQAFTEISINICVIWKAVLGLLTECLTSPKPKTQETDGRTRQAEKSCGLSLDMGNIWIVGGIIFLAVLIWKLVGRKAGENTGKPVFAMCEVILKEICDTRTSYQCSSGMFQYIVANVKYWKWKRVWKLAQRWSPLGSLGP